jgi:hypothetical protein
MNGRSQEQLLTNRKAVALMAAGGISICLVTFVANLWGEFWCVLAMATFAAGHFILVMVLTRGRLNFPHSLTGPWLDFLTVMYAPWFGPVGWYLAWKKAQALKSTTDEKGVAQ